VSTRSEIAARKAAIAAVINGHNTFAADFNAGAAALTPIAADFQELIIVLNRAAVAHNESIPLILAEKNRWDAEVPSDPLPEQPESIQGTRGAAVVDSSHAVWTLGAALPSLPGMFQLLRDAVWMAGGGGSEYLYWNHTVYVKSVNGAWFSWGGSSWITAAFGDPSLPAPDPTAPPNTTSAALLSIDSSGVAHGWASPPGGQVLLWLDDVAPFYLATSDTSGNWSFQVPLDRLPHNSHHLLKADTWPTRGGSIIQNLLDFVFA
jgi:hypothetical protein